MSVTPSSHVVGMFTERAAADDAVEALHNAGFEDERISYSTPGASGGFFEDLKSLFTGANPGADNLIHNLTDVGLSSEQAQYYADEYNSGNTILVVNAPGREEQVLSILHQFGAYSAHSAGVQFGGAHAASTSADSVAPAVDATQTSEYASTQAEPVSYTGSEAEVQHGTPDLDTQSQFQYQSANDQPLTSQPQDVTPITPLHDVEDQPTQPVTSEYATEPHHASDEVLTHEYNMENGTGASDLLTPEHELATSTAQSSVDAPTSQVEDQTVQPTTASDYAATEDQVVHPAATTPDYETVGESAVHSVGTTTDYGTLESETAQPASYGMEGEQAVHSAATTTDYGTSDIEGAQPLDSDYGTGEDQVVHPAATTSEYPSVEASAVQPSTTASDYEIAGDQASYTSVTTPAEDRTENQMAEPTSVAPEHEIEEGLPQVGEQPAVDQSVFSTADTHAATEEPLLSQQGVAEPEPAVIEQTGQPESVLTTHDVAQQQVTQDSAFTSEPDAVTQEQPILNSTIPPIDGGTLDSTVTPDSTVAPDSTVTTAQPETVTTPDTAVAASQPETTVTTPPAQTSAPVVDYAGKLQSLLQQLQASQQQLQEVKARLQAAKEHETQIQATQQQLKAIQDELAAAHAELNETHSRIDQY
ncbi:MAG: hypothetical protein H0U76_10140 [Ktedonobacteraceae bacterium]|nr:hypothetical protein [Ktedonobacteraceae bacterium]